MKKIISFILIVVLLLSMCVSTGFAAGKEPSYYYELSIDGKDTVEVRKGDIITVTLHLNRMDENVPYTMCAMQDEIRYDSTFFKLVENSAILNDGVHDSDIARETPYREFYMNYVSMSGGKQWEPRTRVGSFQLEVIAESGVTTITNEDYLVSLVDGSGSYPCEANELTVILTTDCTVRFVTNGGTKVDDVNVLYGEKLSRPADPTRDGMEFVGWYKDVYLSQLWDFDKDIVKGNMTLYAKWKEVEAAPTHYTLSLNTNGGVLSYNPSGEHAIGTEIVLPEPTREGYIFKGWSDGTNVYKADDTIALNSDVILTAQWEINRVSLKLVPNGGIIVDNPSGTYAEGTEIVLPEPTREGYIFKGWSDGTNVYKANDTITLNSDMVLTAQWEINPSVKRFSLILHADGGAIENNPSGEYAKGTEIVLPRPYRQGYVFKGWSDGTTTYKANDTITLNSDMVLTAQWVINPNVKVSLKLILNGGKVESNPSGSYAEGTEIILPEPTREGYIFMGWNNGKTLKAAGSKIILSENITFEAVWETIADEGIVLAINVNGGEVSENVSGIYMPGEQVTLPDAIREGYVFKGWSDGTTVYEAYATITLTSSLSLTAQWETAPADRVILKLSLANGKLNWDPSGEHPIGTVLTLPIPTREGFIFKGWKHNKVIYAAGEEITLNESMTFRATWEDETISAEKVTYNLDLNGGSLVWNPSGEYPIGTIVKLPEPYLAGYVLDYWECDGKIYAASMEITLDTSKSFKAVWVEDDNYNVPVWKPDYKIDSLITDKHVNYVIGYLDGTILPKNNITRAEVAVIFYRLLSEDFLTKYESVSNNFQDVKEGMWHNKAISTLSNAGILTGYPDGNFYPNKNITRAELAAIIDRFADAKSGEASFSDVAGHWAYENIATAEVNGWITGYPDGTFQPNKAITRAETFAVVNRLLGRFVNSVNSLLPGMNQFIDNMNTSAWYYFDVQEAANNHEYTRLDDGKYERWTKLLENIVY